MSQLGAGGKTEVRRTPCGGFGLRRPTRWIPRYVRRQEPSSTSRRRPSKRSARAATRRLPLDARQTRLPAKAGKLAAVELRRPGSEGRQTLKRFFPLQRKRAHPPTISIWRAASGSCKRSLHATCCVSVKPPRRSVHPRRAPLARSLRAQGGHVCRALDPQPVVQSKRAATRNTAPRGFL